MSRLHVQVLEEDSVHSAPSREVEEPQGAADHQVVDDRYVAVESGPCVEERRTQLRVGERAVLTGAFVGRQLVDQSDDRTDVLGLDATDGGGLGQTFTTRVDTTLSCRVCFRASHRGHSTSSRPPMTVTSRIAWISHRTNALP